MRKREPHRIAVVVAGAALSGISFGLPGCGEAFSNGCKDTLTCSNGGSAGVAEAGAGGVGAAGETSGQGGTETSFGGHAGEAGASSGGSVGEVGGAGSAGAEDTAGSIGTVGQPCAPNGSYGCSAHASAHQIVCSGGVWVGNGTCAPGTLCDTREGATAGSCQPILAQCENSAPGDKVCTDQSVEICGPDLTTATVAEACSGATPACLDGACVACVAGDTRCSGNGVESCSAAGVWSAPANCPATAPACSAGECVPPSCADLPPTCGASGTESCCTSPQVKGGTFNRGNDAKYPADVGSFHLDTYEVTVGRFHRFYDAFSQDMIPAGAGKNPNDPNDTGWDSSWSSLLPADQGGLKEAVQCQGMYQTWTGNDDNLPMNCLDWYLAYAFCAWDQGRLPSEAEWNYAAAGGAEQRTYPWGAAVPGPDTALAVYDCYWNGKGQCTSATNIAPVGSVPAGNGKWKQADLAGGLFEWVKDFYGDYPTPCTNCSNQVMSSVRGMRGGAFNYDSSALLTSARNYDSQAHYYIGARCARDQ